jgi:hypothetical protein
VTDRRVKLLALMAEGPDHMTLDEVDVSREIGGHFHANGLFADLRLVPDFHFLFPPIGVGFTFIHWMTPPRTIHLMWAR